MAKKSKDKGKGKSKEGGKRIRAAGGVVVRKGKKGPEVAVVHRPRYDDWSLPKGKLDDGEKFEEAALREVEEETGLRCKLGDELERNIYTDHKGREKVVRWWLMRVKGDGGAPFEPNDEVDELRWLAPAKAAKLVSYDHDRLLLAGLRET